MAAVTMTYTANMSTSPKAVHVGVNQVAFSFNSGATKFGTLSDMVLLAKIPSGALITSKTVRMGATGATAGPNYQLQLLAIDSLGTFTLVTTLMDSLTASATAQAFTDSQPYKLSLSDDRAVQYAVLVLNASTGASATVSQSIQGVVNYLMDGSVI